MTSTFGETGLRVNPTPKTLTSRLKKEKKKDKIEIMINWKLNNCNLMSFRLFYHNPEKNNKKSAVFGRIS